MPPTLPPRPARPSPYTRPARPAGRPLASPRRCGLRQPGPTRHFYSRRLRRRGRPV